MSFLSNLIGGGVVTAAEGVAGIVDRFVETDDEKRAAEIIKAKMMMRPGEVQAEINKIEAGHRSIFVAGWRPAIGWVAAISLFSFYVPQYVLASVIWVEQTLEQGHIVDYPATAGGLIELVIGLLGLGGLRTLEKMQGKAK